MLLLLPSSAATAPCPCPCHPLQGDLTDRLKMMDSEAEKKKKLALKVSVSECCLLKFGFPNVPCMRLAAPAPLPQGCSRSTKAGQQGGGRTPDPTPDPFRSPPPESMLCFLGEVTLGAVLLCHL